MSPDYGDSGLSKIEGCMISAFGFWTTVGNSGANPVNTVSITTLTPTAHLSPTIIPSPL